MSPRAARTIWTAPPRLNRSPRSQAFRARTFPFSDSGRPIGCDRLPGSWPPSSRLPVVSLRSTTGYHLGPLGGVLGAEDLPASEKINPIRMEASCAAVAGGGKAPNGSSAIPGGCCASGRLPSAARPRGGCGRRESSADFTDSRRLGLLLGAVCRERLNLRESARICG